MGSGDTDAEDGLQEETVGHGCLASESNSHPYPPPLSLGCCKGRDPSYSPGGITSYHMAKAALAIPSFFVSVSGPVLAAEI